MHPSALRTGGNKMRIGQAPIENPTSSLEQDTRRERSNRHAENRPADYRVLVVDDDAAVCEAVAKILSSFGYTVSRADDGLAAMSHLATSQYDLVITDFDMPLMNGYRLSVWLKQESPGTIVVIMTAACQAEINQYMLTGLVDKWLFKPFGAEVLCEALSTVGLPTDFCQTS
jgi:CheY-like chemotaxis protein